MKVQKPMTLSLGDFMPPPIRGTMDYRETIPLRAFFADFARILTFVERIPVIHGCAMCVNPHGDVANAFSVKFKYPKTKCAVTVAPPFGVVRITSLLTGSTIRIGGALKS